MRLFFIFVLCAAGPIFAEQRNYKVSIGGFHAGILSISDSTNARSYKVAARVAYAGIAAFFGKTLYEGTTVGRIRAGRLIPTRYEGFTSTGDRSRTVTQVYRNGTPQVILYDPSPPPEAFTIDPFTQRGTVDILSSAYWVFRQRPLSELCDVTYYGFDGLRRTEIKLEAPTKRNGKVICEARYTRVAGFSERALKRGQVFPLTLTYVESEGGYVLEQIQARTVFGRARVTLKN